MSESPNEPPDEPLPDVLFFSRDMPEALDRKQRRLFYLTCGVSCLSTVAFLLGSLVFDLESILDRLPFSPAEGPTFILAVSVAVGWPWIFWGSWIRRRVWRYYGHVELHRGFAQVRHPKVTKVGKLGPATYRRFKALGDLEVRTHGILLSEAATIPTADPEERARALRFLGEYAPSDDVSFTPDRDVSYGLYTFWRVVWWVGAGLAIGLAALQWVISFISGPWPPAQLGVYALPITAPVFFYVAKRWLPAFTGDSLREQIFELSLLEGGLSLGVTTDCVPFARLKKIARAGDAIAVEFTGPEGENQTKILRIGDPLDELWPLLRARLDSDLFVDHLDWVPPQTTRRRLIAAAVVAVSSALQGLTLIP